MRTAAVDCVTGQLKGSRGIVEVRIDIYKNAHDDYSFTILPIKPKGKGKQVAKPLGVELSLSHVMDDVFYIFSDSTKTESFSVDIHGQDDKKKRYLAQDCNDDMDFARFTQQSTQKVALPSDDNWDENTNGNTPKKVILVDATEPSQIAHDASIDDSHASSTPAMNSSSGSTSSNHAMNRPSQTRSEVVMTTSASSVSGIIGKVLSAFEDHIVAIVPTVKTPFDKTICMHAMEIAKSSQAEVTAKHVVSKTLASEFRPALRELFLLYGIAKISPDEYGKKGKSAICTVLLDVFSKMTPEQYKRQVRESLELPLRNALAKFSIHTLMVNVPRDESLTVGDRWYFGSDADLRVELEASTSSAATEESSQLLAFTEWLAREEPPSVCIMDWTSCINEHNFTQFPLLDVDPKSGYVQKPSSLFHGMRRARTYTEWISQLYYIILTTFAHVSPNALAGSDLTLVHRCKSSARSMREGSATLSDIVKKTFMRSAAVEAVFFGTTLFWRLVGEKGKVGQTSQLRLATLFAQRVKRNYLLLTREKSNLKTKVLSVKDMFNPQTTDCQRRPTVADIDAADFFSDDDN